MTVELELAPKTKRPAGEPCCVPVVQPDVDRERAERMATVAKALGDPVRMQLVDVLRKAAREDVPAAPSGRAIGLDMTDEQALAAAGLEEIEINATHRVHEHASSAIIRARKP